LGLVRGTGIEGRVTRHDVLAYIENPMMHMMPPGEGEGVVGVSQKERTAKAPAPPRAPAETPAPDAEAKPPEPAAAPVAVGEDDERVALTATRRTIAARMLQSHQTMPVAWMMVEADVTGLVALRDRLKDEFKQREGGALTY